MPARSRQAKAAASRVRCPTTNRFAADKKAPVPVDEADDEYYHIDGDFHEIGEDEEEDVVARLRNWRPTGWNINVRGAGTSKSTHFRNKKKNADTALAAQKCQAIELFFALQSSSSSTLPFEEPSTIPQTIDPSASAS